MKRKSNFWKGLGIGALIALLLGCGPPSGVDGQGPYPACTAAVTLAWEGDPFPCAPVPPQRVDYFFEQDGSVAVGNKKCYAAGGQPTNETPQYEGWTHCRSLPLP